MASEEHFTQLRKGVSNWNAWRKEHDITPNLREVELSEEYLVDVDLRGAKLQKAKLITCFMNRANLSGADLSEANLIDTQLAGANLSRANLSGALLITALLGGANLNGADLTRADLRGADLDWTTLCEANLRLADLRQANLAESNLNRARVGETIFADVDLSKTKGLETCVHERPSVLDHRTLEKSGRLPLVFLRGCGLPDQLIDYLPSLLGEATHYYSCFISYSSKDNLFAKRIHTDLQSNGVRCWFAPQDLPIGAKIWDAIDAAIRVRDKVLLILSKNAIASGWIEDEVAKAFAEERRRNQLVLFPVRLDEAVMKTTASWAVKLRDQRNIGDFRKWKEHYIYQEAFKQLLRDLKTVT